MERVICQTRTSTVGNRCEEWVENLINIFSGQSHTTVGDRDQQMTVLGELCRNDETTAGWARMLSNRLRSIAFTAAFPL
jgi:hypothetical protein